MSPDIHFGVQSADAGIKVTELSLDLTLPTCSNGKGKRRRNAERDKVNSARIELRFELGATSLSTVTTSP